MSSSFFRKGKQKSADVVSNRSATTARFTKSHSQPTSRPSSPAPSSGDGDADSPYKLTYIGNLTLDKRVTEKMFKWVLVDIKRSRNVNKQGMMTVADARVKFISSTDSSDVMLEHNVHTISRFTRCVRDRRCFFYVQRNSIDAPDVMFAFTCLHDDIVVNIFDKMQKSARTTPRPGMARKQDIYKMFEVRFQGQIAIGERSKSGEFIDQWLVKRQSHLLGHEGVKKGSYLELHSPRERHWSDGSGKSMKENVLEGPPGPPDQGRLRHLSEGDGRDRCDSMNSSKSGSTKSEDHLNTFDSGMFDGEDRQGSLASTNSVMSDVLEEGGELSGDQRRPNLITLSDTNKTMLFQIDDTKTSVFSLGKKSVILEKTHQEISYCTQGKKFSDHFGFISYDNRARQECRKEQYIMYIFQCASDHVILEVMDTLRNAFDAVHKRSLEMQNCDHCPMQQYHRLCEDLTSIKDSESAYNCVQNHIINLSMSDYTDLMNKVKTEQCSSYEEANDVLMTKLRIMCELRQMDHVHGKETDFNILHSKHSKLNALKNRAKKALAFDMMGKVKSQELEWKSKEGPPVPELNLKELNDNDLSSPVPSPTAKIALNIVESLTSPSGRPRSRTIGDIQHRTAASTDSLTSHDGDRQSLLQKLSNMGHSLEEAFKGEKTNTPDKRSSPAVRKISMPVYNTDVVNDMVEITGPMSDRKKHRRMSSWRRDIFESVVTTPSGKAKQGNSLADQPVRRSLGQEELRGMWRSAIEQTILLNRMEKENTNLREHEEMMKRKRAQLDYQDVTPCRDDVMTKWRSLLGKVKVGDSSNRLVTPKVDLWNLVKEGPASLRDMVKHGVPRSKRGEIWTLLARQYNISIKGLHNQAEERPTDMMCYKDLLQGLTPHQHAILIDLGRTFPQHEYFKMQLGAGQLALFNILKAYSLVDTEVGYCQGLGFVAGILLMHINEEESFELLCHLMYELGLRKLYKPNMAGLQVSMYQLARLMRDRHSALYNHLEELDVTPTLYAAPWFITLFSSQFSIGFVSRVFDFLYMEGYTAVFKIALSLIAVHEEAILSSDSFESVTNVLKTTLPDMSSTQMKLVFEKANSLDLSNELYTYQIEYHVMEEDIAAVADTGGDNALVKLELANSKLRDKNSKLAEKINSQTYKLHNQETMIDALQQSHAKLTRQVRELEMQRVKHIAVIEQLKGFIPHHLLKQLDNLHLNDDFTATSTLNPNGVVQ